MPDRDGDDDDDDEDADEVDGDNDGGDDAANEGEGFGKGDKVGSITPASVIHSPTLVFLRYLPYSLICFVGPYLTHSCISLLLTLLGCC
jgi:hypothetical protein